VNADRERFERMVLPHLDAAYNLARWLTRNDHDAEDVLQDAMLRAFRHFAGLRGEARPWLLAVVRNACWSWLQANRPADIEPLDDALADDALPGPEAALARALDRRMLNEALAALPAQFREALILRELEDLSYGDIARITGAPIGTVMSRLSRARQALSNATLASSANRRLRIRDECGFLVCGT